LAALGSPSQAQASVVVVTKRLQPARRHPQTDTIPHAAPQSLATLAEVSGNPQSQGHCRTRLCGFPEWLPRTHMVAACAAWRCGVALCCGR
jgi:hypothetical protein